MPEKIKVSRHAEEYVIYQRYAMIVNRIKNNPKLMKNFNFTEVNSKKILELFKIILKK